MNDPTIEVLNEEQRKEWVDQLDTIRSIKSLTDESRHAFFQALSLLVPNVLAKEQGTLQGMAFTHGGEEVERIGGKLAEASSENFLRVTILPAVQFTVLDELRIERVTANQTLGLALFINKKDGKFSHATISSTAEGLTARIDSSGEVTFDELPDNPLKDTRSGNLSGLVAYMMNEEALGTATATVDLFRAGF